MKPAFHPSHTPWKSLRGFPHYHGYGDDYHVSEDRQSPPQTRNPSHSRRKGLVNHVSGLKRKGCPGTLTSLCTDREVGMATGRSNSAFIGASICDCNRDGGTSSPSAIAPGAGPFPSSSQICMLSESSRSVVPAIMG